MSKALQKTYDGIVIGAGHHGLILASYLAKAGLDILLVERRLTYGGGLCTREVTLPGFYHNGSGSFAFTDGHSEFKRWLDPRSTPPIKPGIGYSDRFNSPNNPDIGWLQDHATRPKVR